MGIIDLTALWTHHFCDSINNMALSPLFLVPTPLRAALAVVAMIATKAHYSEVIGLVSFPAYSRPLAWHSAGV